MKQGANKYPGRPLHNIPGLPSELSGGSHHNTKVDFLESQFFFHQNNRDTTWEFTLKQANLIWVGIKQANQAEIEDTRRAFDKRGQNEA